MKKRFFIIPAAVVFAFFLLLISVVLLFTDDSDSTSSTDYPAGYDLPSFVTNEMMQAFFEVQEEFGIPVSSGVAQLIGESGFGLYGPGGEEGQGLSQLAYEYKNLFGIKYFSGDSYAIGAVDMQTGEQTGTGESYTTVGCFSIYPDYVSCIRQRAWMLMHEDYYSNILPYLNENNGRYSVEMANQFVEGIRAGGWATDTEYVRKCIQLMEIYNLYQFDNMTWEQYQGGSGSGSGDYTGTVTPVMERIVEIARNNQGTYPCLPDYCAAWVTGVYQAAGAPVVPYGDAIDMWNVYRDTGSASMENIPPGAVVCGSGSGEMGARYGHVGIYLGDGLVANNVGSFSIEAIESWCAWQTANCQGHVGWIGWVYPGGIPQ